MSKELTSVDHMSRLQVYKRDDSSDYIYHYNTSSVLPKIDLTSGMTLHGSYKQDALYIIRFLDSDSRHMS